MLQNWKKEYEVDEFSNFYTFYYGGFNLRSTDLQAFLGLRQIKKAGWVANKRHENHCCFDPRLQKHSKTHGFSNNSRGATQNKI